MDQFLNTITKNIFVKNNFQMIKVSKTTLVLITGFIWTTIGLMLIGKATNLIEILSTNQLVISCVLGIILSFVKVHFVFNKTTKHNISRIMNLKHRRVSIFAFHTFKFYILILFMIGFGILLRNLDFVPKYVIFPIYIGVGIGMLYSSLKYFIFWQAVSVK